MRNDCEHGRWEDEMETLAPSPASHDAAELVAGAQIALHYFQHGCHLSGLAQGRRGEGGGGGDGGGDSGEGGGGGDGGGDSGDGGGGGGGGGGGDEAAGASGREYVCDGILGEVGRASGALRGVACALLHGQTEGCERRLFTAGRL